MQITRRSVTTGLGAAVAGAGLSFSQRSNAEYRLQYHLEQVEHEMREPYGAQIESHTWEPTPEGAGPLILIVAKT